MLFFFQALYLPSKGKYMSSSHLVNGDAFIRQRITGIWGTEERRDSETQCGFSSCSHFRCTGWDTKKRGKLGFSPFLDAFSSPGYFWSQCISGKTSTNGTKASSLTTNSGLYLKLPGVAHTSPPSAPGKAQQVCSLQRHTEPSLTRH